MTDVKTIRGRYEGLRQRYAECDQRMQQVASVRAGNAISPGLFPVEWPKPIIANFIDTVARDLAEVLAPLPAVNCNGTNVIDDKARSKADKRTTIANYYLYASRCELQMLAAADQFLTYGFLPFRVEAMVKEERPHIHLDDPMGGYPEFDRWGNTVAYAKVWKKTGQELAALFPESRGVILGNGIGDQSQALIEVVKWYDADSTVLFLPSRGDHVLASVKNPLGRCPVHVAVRPTLDGDMRGQFDDVLWVQMARAKMALLKLDAAHKAVEAPLALPQDVQHLPIGGDAILRSNSPEKIRRVPLDVPQAAFAEDGALEREMRLGARYPEARGGNVDASIITGRGVQALMGGFDTQIQAAQRIFAYAYEVALSLAFELDEKLWGDREKTIKGTHNGQPYKINYRPSTAISGDYTVDVEYGLLGGLDPNRGLVWLLQGRAEKLFSRSFARRNLPVNMNASQEEQVIDIEDGRDALKAAVAATSQALPEIVAQGGDPSAIIASMATFISERKKGVSLEEAAAAAFKPPEPEAVEPPPGSEPPGEVEAPGEASGPSGSGAGPDIPAGTMGLPAGSRPDMATMLAALGSGGKPVLQAGVMRRRAIS